MAAHRYWRLLIHTNGSGDAWCAIGDLYGYTNISGTVNVLTGGTAAASSTYSTYVPANAFDNNQSTAWITNTFANGTWISYDLGVGNALDIEQIWYRPRGDGFYNQAPAQCDWQWSDDNTTWTTLFSFTASTSGWNSPNNSFIYPQAPTGMVRATTTDVLAAFVNPATTGERSTGAFVLTAINGPTVSERTTISPTLVARQPAADLRSTDSALLVAIFQSAAERTLRAWTFTQDDHDFYVLMAYGETYVYDKLTGEWAQWSSPDTITPSYPTGYWRGIDGVEWDGINICIDPDSGKVFKIDPTGRLDYGTTPITSQVVGGLTDRFRNYVPVYMAEVAISQAKPPTGIDPTTLGITLETFDTVNWTTIGTVNGSVVPTFTYPRFYGLGLIGSPGMLFRITDTGYARRIDGLNIEVGADKSAMNGNQ